MSYLDPLGGHTSRDDWSSGPDDGGRDERPRARHSGAAPDPYVPDRPVDLGDAPDPYAAFREAKAVPTAAPFVAGGSVGDVEPSGDGTGAYLPRSDGPAWDPPTAATSTSQAEYELVVDPDRQRGRGRRRAGRPGTTGQDRAAQDGAAQARAAQAGAAQDGAVDPARHAGRAGRNLPAAIGVGSGLGVVLLAALFIWPPALIGVIAVATGVGIWEMVRAIRTSGAQPPLIPLVAGGVLMVGLAGYAGADGLTLGLVVTVLASMLWRLGDGRSDLRRDFTATLLISVYVPFLLGFGVLLLEPGDGNVRVLATLLAVVLSDTGGYAAGVFLGKHPMAPTISPKKSWEGFAGSVAAAAIGSALLLSFGLDVPVAWYAGALFGVVIAIVAVMGDLTESMMKRDLGIKDMSQLLPGHGGLMDRLDSVVFAVPTAYLLLSLIAPPG
jgi:phosphatidate cytidylyltransferase